MQKKQGISHFKNRKPLDATTPFAKAIAEKRKHNTPFGYSVKTGGLQNTGTKLNK